MIGRAADTCIAWTAETILRIRSSFFSSYGERGKDFFQLSLCKTLGGTILGFSMSLYVHKTNFITRTRVSGLLPDGALVTCCPSLHLIVGVHVIWQTSLFELRQVKVLDVVLSLIRYLIASQTSLFSYKSTDKRLLGLWTSPWVQTH